MYYFGGFHYNDNKNGIPRKTKEKCEKCEKERMNSDDTLRHLLLRNGRKKEKRRFSKINKKRNKCFEDFPKVGLEIYEFLCFYKM